MYADDTTVTCKGLPENKLMRDKQSSLDLLSNWFSSNKLMVNVTKSNMMLIGTRSKANAFQNHIIVNINGSSIPLSNNIKLLGVTIDTYLTFEDQIEYIISKVVSKIGILHWLRQILPFKAQTIYIVIIQSVFDYCLMLWVNNMNKNKCSPKIIEQSSQGDHWYFLFLCTILNNKRIT